MAVIHKALDNAKEIFPICIPSWKRYNPKDNPTLSKLIGKCDSDIKENTYLFVRSDQEKQYRDSFEFLGINIVVLPPVNGLSTTRQYICDYVLNVLHKPFCADWDDDLTALKYVYKAEDGKIKNSPVADTDVNKIIRLSCEISKTAFEQSNCLLGSVRRAHFSNDPKNYDMAYFTNKGATPRSATFINCLGLAQRGIRRNKAFDPTGDDVGFVAEIAKCGGDFFNIPCLTISFVDDEVNSVIRNDENRRELAAYEYSEIKKYPMGRSYLRIPFRYPDGFYKYSDIDFEKYRKLYNKKTERISLGALCKTKRWE